MSAGPSTANLLNQAEAWVLEVEETVRRLDPTAFPVVPRVLRRVLRAELDLSGVWTRLPHRKAFVVDRDRLFWLVEVDELGVSSSTALPARPLLLARPEANRLKQHTPTTLLRHYARLLFHLRIDEAWAAGQESGRIRQADVRARISELGQSEFDEIVAVLSQEGMLYRPQNLAHAYGEFLAWFSELRLFAPELIPIYFPSLRDRESVERLLRRVVDTDAIFAQLQQAGLVATEAPAVRRHVTAMPAAEAERVSAVRMRRWLQAGETSLKKGNRARGLLSFQRALSAAPVSDKLDVTTRLQATLSEFVAAICHTLHQSEREGAQWQTLLASIIPAAAAGYWNSHARFLMDLQKACLDATRMTYRVDMWSWMLTWGRRPLKQPLPDLPVVLVCKHLRTATNRLSKLNLAAEVRHGLSELLHEGLHHAEERLRTEFRPQVAQSLVAAGMVPRHDIERLSFDKLVDELLDLAGSRGFISMSDVRDGIARGNLKLGDLESLSEFFGGDLLLRINRQLGQELPGAYQKGPFYLTWLQRFNSLVFGTMLGRAFTRFIALPFGGAYLCLEGLQHLLEPLCHLLNVHAPHLATREMWLVLSSVFFALLHSSQVRQWSWALLVAVWNVTRWTLIDWPIRLMKWPLLQRLLKSVPVIVLRRYLLAPLAITMVFSIALPNWNWYPAPDFWKSLVIFLGLSLLVNSRLGRDTEELTSEWIEHTWQRFRVNVVLALFQWVVDGFRAVMDFVERVLYAVDEYLRFHSGESSTTLAIKAVLSLVWGVVHGVVRFCVTLLVEPQINPIKHFPVVTVSHKLILPLVPQFQRPIASMLEPMIGGYFATAAPITIASIIPGVFGFLAWELKENWKLYRANQPQRLQPQRVGSHGETLLRLLRPGFHSGTIPKLYARRRRAARKLGLEGAASRLAWTEEQLHHVKESIAHIIERVLLRLLDGTRAGQALGLQLGEICLGVNRIDVELRQRGTEQTFLIRWCEQSGWLVAELVGADWLKRLPAEQQAVLHSGLAGLYAMGPVDLVREHVALHLGNPPYPYDIADQGLVAWVDQGFETEVVYDLDERPELIPRPRAVAREAKLVPVAVADMLFCQHQVDYAVWASYWTGQPTGRILDQVRLMPAD